MGIFAYDACDKRCYVLLKESGAVLLLYNMLLFDS